MHVYSPHPESETLRTKSRNGKIKIEAISPTGVLSDEDGAGVLDGAADRTRHGGAVAIDNSRGEELHGAPGSRQRGQQRHKTSAECIIFNLLNRC